MAKNKKPDNDQPSETEILQQRVDAMLDPAKPDPSPAAPQPAAANSPAPPEIDIFKDAGTAPEVSADLLKKIGVDDKAAPAAKKSIPVSSLPDTKTPQLVKYREPVKPAPTDKTEETAPPSAPEPLPVPSKAAGEPADLKDEDPYADPATDKAVDDIVVHEADTLLAVEDANKEQAPAAAPKHPAKPNDGNKFAELLRKKWFWPALVLVLLAVLFAIPTTRYKLAGLVLKKPVTITVDDSVTGAPVSDASVSFRGQSAKTGNNGQVNLKTAPGPGTLTISKQYYKSATQQATVGLGSTLALHIKLVATGRQVPIVIVDKISGQPVAGALIQVLNTSAKTDSHGKATLVLPTDGNASSAVITANGFNLSKVSVTITDQNVAPNHFTLLPTGTVYFLSNHSGTIDVVKTNLDGSNRQTVLKGTGREDARTTSLLASNDWRYLLLSVKRDSAETALYLIDGRTNKLSKIDGSNASYQLVGWSGHNFVYDSVSQDKSRWQPGREMLKSYDADKDNLITLDQNQADGSSSSYAYQSFDNFNLLGGLVAYSTQWYTFDSSGGSYNLSGKTASIRGDGADGQGKKDYQTFDTSGLTYIQSALATPQTLYFGAYDSSAGKLTYYQFDGQKVTTPSSVDQNTFAKTYPTYLASPSGKQTAWSDQRDGKNVVLAGDTNANNPRQLTTSGTYSAYGWYSDNYLLVTQNGSQLFIMPAGGLSAGAQPLKVSDYYKPAQTYTGYGGQ